MRWQGWHFILSNPKACVPHLPPHVPPQDLRTLWQVLRVGSALVRVCLPRAQVSRLQWWKSCFSPLHRPFLCFSVITGWVLRPVISITTYGRWLPIGSEVGQVSTSLSAPAPCRISQKLHGFSIIGGQPGKSPVICGSCCTQGQTLELVGWLTVHPLHEALSSSMSTCWMSDGSGVRCHRNELLMANLSFMGHLATLNFGFPLL